MKKQSRLKHRFASLLALGILLNSCITYQYIRDPQTLKLQKEIRGTRTGNVLGDSFLTLGSGVVAALTGVYVGYTPGARNLRHLSLLNQSADTLQVNMLTDQVWKDSTYCDFRNIRIPPGEKCRLLVPVNSVYNLYFSNTPDSEEDDEFLEINTSLNSKIILTPGMTLENKSDTTKTIHPILP